MRTILFKDLTREIKHSFSRFISITILIAFGSAFFIGLKSAPLNMVATGEAYFDQHVYFDIRLQSNDRFTPEEQQEIAALSDVAYVQPKYIIQGITKENSLVLEVESLAQKQLEVTSGREPQAVDEIILDKKAEKYFQLGDTIQLLDNEEKPNEWVNQEHFTIVGFANSYRYLGQNIRGASSLGDGELDLFAAVLEEAFTLEEPNSIDLHLNREIRDQPIYSDAYLDKLTAVSEEIGELRDQQQSSRKEILLEEIADSEAELQEQKTTVTDSLSAIDQTLQQLKAAAAQQVIPQLLTETNQQIAAAESQQQELQDTEKELTDSLAELPDKRAEVADIAYQLTPIDETSSFYPFKENIQRLDALGNIIPLVFYFVAGLVTVMIITRMIQQERKQIGTLKALGVDRKYILQKYQLYSLISGALGTAAGVLFGIYVFSPLLVSLYSPMYVIELYQVNHYWAFTGIILIISLVCIILIPALFYRNTLADTPLQLMRGQVMSNGQKILLEKLPALWRRLSFNSKMNMRNIFRYKYRMMLLFAGILGCCSLLIISFGARNSVSQLIDSQFSDVLHYDLSISRKKQASAEAVADYQTLLSENAQRSILTFQEKGQISYADGSLDLTLVSPDPKQETPALEQFIHFTDSQTQNPLLLEQDQVFLTQKAAKLLAVSPGDQVTVKLSNKETVTFPITGIVNNYFLDYLYIAPNIWQQADIKDSYTAIDLLQGTLDKETQETIIKSPAVSGLQFMTTSIERAEEVTSQLNYLLIIIIIASALLGLVVVYNLVYINALERNQELAVLRVMGYTNFKLTRYLFREIVFLGIFAIASGSWLGFFGHDLVMSQIELDSFCFPTVNKLSVTLSTCATLLLTTFFLFILMYRKMQEIDAVSALKDRE